LDSVTRLIDPESPNPTNAREALLILRATLPRLGTAADSTWAYIRSAEAHLILEQEEPACQALRTARRTASTMDQTRAINNYVGLLGCSQ
jgi:serine/threonine-protein kinase